MYTTTPAEAPAAVDIWAGVSALRLLEDAEAQLYDISAETSRLIEDAAWRNSAVSVRALQKHLGELAQAIGREVVAVREQQARVRQGMQL